MQEHYKILVSAYACAPNLGSEPGMGWNFIQGLANHHEVHVISEKSKWETPIRDFINENPQLKNNLKFYFVEKKRYKFLRKIWPPSYYWFYRSWQKEVYKLALKLNNEENFDLIHQLNMIGFREPGYLWKINKPFVWGPIGGLDNSPWAFLPKLGIKGMIFYTGRNIINCWQRKFNIRPKKAASRLNSALIAATPTNSQLIQKLWGQQAVVISEVGQHSLPNLKPKSRSINEPLKIIWSGMHTPGKNLALLFDALHKITFPFEVHILGEGEMTAKWKKMAKNLGIVNQCTWYGWISRDEAMKIMHSGHTFCITSISDATSSVSLEALSLGLPIVCLDHCGYAHVVDETCGLKVPVNTPSRAAINFSKALETLFINESYRQELSRGALIRAEAFSWKTKIENINKIYSSFFN